VDFRAQAEQLLATDKIVIPEEFKRNARRFLYYQLYRSSLPFDPFLTTHIHPSLTRFKRFSWEQLLPENSTAIATILDGVLNQGDFLLKE
jgi:hypothetical protein